MAPEVLQNRPHSEAADVYSFAIVLWEMLTGQEPWAGVESAAALACEVSSPRSPVHAATARAGGQQRLLVSNAVLHALMQVVVRRARPPLPPGCTMAADVLPVGWAAEPVGHCRRHCSERSASLLIWRSFASCFAQGLRPGFAALLARLEAEGCR